jgi:DNA topoisomerase-1
MGHVRDLETKGLSVDVDNGFKPTYVVPPRSREVVRELKDALKNVDELYLATDEDREGESISWHLLEVLNPRVPVKRMVFHEITRAAIEAAVENWREVDYGLVDAADTRRIVDRLFGYPVSEVLWRKVNRGLSAGRVQSVATRLVVERERERIRFVSAGYWDLEASFSTAPSFNATLLEVGGRRVATGKDFDESGTLQREQVVVLDESAARDLGGRLGDSTFTVRSVEEKPYRSSPKPPFSTSTLQQEGGRKLRLGARDVMRVAQGLYERGYITYMRTDSVALSETAIIAARNSITGLYGKDYMPDRPRTYANKSKNAQEAHEAIRPAGETWRTPDQLSHELRGNDLRLYELIWMRTVASQMSDATGRTVSVRIAAKASGDQDTLFAASGRTITFPGYLRAYVEGSDDPEADLEDRESILPPLAEGDVVPLESLEANGHTTNPPPRYTEASLVKRMEELGVGRPSTYASIINTIQDRGYVRKKGTALIATWTAFAVTNLLERHFTALVDYAFTARMEDDLDLIAERAKEREPWLHDFWFGNGVPGLFQLTTDGLSAIDPVEINSIPIGDGDIVLRVGKYGPYLQRGDERASVPEDIAPDELTVERAEELLTAPSGDRELGPDPESGLTVFARAGRYGPYVQLGEIDAGSKAKPRTASLLSTMALDTVTLDDALRLLTLPRVVGVDPSDEVEITAQNGRYGPYIKKGSDSRSLESEEQMFTVTLDEALAIFAQPKLRRGQRAAAPPLKELGPDPVSGQPVVVKEGRFGPYVTDGETNASLRSGDTVDTITIERAAELLELRREAGPVKKRGAKRAAKKSGAKKAAAKKTAANKTAAKKPAAKKPAAKAAAAKKPASKKAAAKKSAAGGDTTVGDAPHTSANETQA